MHVNSAISEVQGGRQYMEDRSIAIDNMKETVPNAKYKKELSYSYWAVYDGHSGFKAAEMCKESLHKILIENDMFFYGDMSKAIQVS